MSAIGALLRSAHPGPAVAVTVLSALLGVALDLPAGRLALVALTVLVGQLTIGWSNDLVDAARDRQVGRTDKPVASGEVGARTVRVACAAALVAVVPLSLACGPAAGLVHLGCVASGWAYNLGMKSTVWSWAPYATCFGGLVYVVALADRPAALPPVWMPVAGALLGVGAHLVNVLPDLADDAATGVRGLPHRIGPAWTPLVATLVLVAASVIIVVGAGLPVLAAGVALAVVAGLAGAALAGRGRVPFLAAIGIALADVVLLVAAR